MGIGFSIFLIAVGAILAFAVSATVAGIDISTVGWILMGAGTIGLILTTILLLSRRRHTVTETTATPLTATTTTPAAGFERRSTEDVL